MAAVRKDVAEDRTIRQDGSAADRIIAAAEMLYGDHGLYGASLRQIGAAAGSGNNYAVQYHFSDAAGLVQAILRRRLPDIDAHQHRLLSAAEAIGAHRDVRTLVEAFFRPLLEQRNAAGHRSYARFVTALLRSPDGSAHCRALFHLTPATLRIIALLRKSAPTMPAGVLEERLRLTAIMTCTSVFNRLAGDEDAVADAALIEDVLDMAAAALVTPPRPAATRRPGPCLSSR